MTTEPTKPSYFQPNDEPDHIIDGPSKRIVIESVGLTTEDAIMHALGVIGGLVKGSKDYTSSGTNGSASGKVSDI